MKRIIALIVLSAMLAGCSNLKGETPSGDVPAPDGEVNSGAESAETSAESAETSEIDFETEPPATEPVVPENGNWITIDDVTAPAPSGYAVFDNDRENYTLEEVRNIVNSFDGFSASKDFYADVPKHIDHIKERTEEMVYDSSNTPLDEQYRGFLETFKYIFKDKPFYPEYVYIRGAFTDSDELFEPFYTYYDEFVSGNKINTDYNYRFSYIDLAHTVKDDTVELIMLYPLGSGDTCFDRGVLGKIIYDNEWISEYTGEKAHITANVGSDKTGYGKYIGTYLPDSEKSYKLLDKETKIKDAVKVFEDYMNSLPTIHEPMYNNRVVKVDVYRFGEDIYAYYFDCAREYDNILYDSIGSGQNMIGGDSFVSDYNLGYMVRSDEVDFADGNFMRFMKTLDEKQYDDIMPFEEAMKYISDNVTSHVEFEVEEARMVYAYTEEFVDDMPRYHCKVYWRIVLHNLNDDFYYFCYQNVRDKDDFRYFSGNNYA